MSGIYYLFSKTDGHEAMYVCDDEKYIEEATYQTGVYPTGTLLSKALRTIEPWTDSNFHRLLHEERLSQAFEQFSTKDSSFSNMVCDDEAARMVLRILLMGNPNIIVDEKSTLPIEQLRSCLGYISLCQRDKQFCSIDKLILISNQMGYRLPKQSIYITEKAKDGLYDRTISELLHSCDFPEQFNPSLKKQRRKFFELPSIGVKLTPYAPLKTPLYIFDIHNIVDLILASLQCAFERGDVVGRCSHCGNLFVTHNRKIKYCPVIDSDNSHDKSCQEKEKLKRQIEKEKKETKKMHKSLRTMYANKYGSDSKECRRFLDESQKWRDRVKEGEVTDEEYGQWLKGCYSRKYK